MGSDGSSARPSALSQHLKVLREAKLVRQRRDGRFRFYTIRPEPLRAVFDWVGYFDRFWDVKLAGLGTYLEKRHGNVPAGFAK